jgi:multiple sugar transport system substrate-binding protein
MAACGGTSAPQGGSAATPISAGAATGAASPAAALGPASLRFVTNHTSDEAKDFQEVIKNFNATYPQIQVKLLNVADTTQFYTSINTQGVGKNLPDVWYTRTFDVTSNAIKGWQLPLGEYVQRDAAEVNVGDIWPALVSQMTYNDQLYSLPYNLSNFVVYYNKTLFEQEGVPPPTADWTWEQAAEIGARFVKKEGNRQTRWGLNFQTYDWFLRGVLQANGGTVFSEDFRQCTVNSPENVATFRFLQDLQARGIAPRPGATPKGVDPFPAGLLAMDVNGSWLIPGYRDSVGKRFEWDIVELPKGSTGDRGVSTAGGAWGISNNTKFKDQAWAFLKHLASTESIDLMVSRRLLSIPGRQSSVAAYEAAAKSTDQPPKNINVVSDQMNGAIEIAYPPYQAEFGTIWGNRVQSIFSGAPPERALEQIMTDTNRVAARYFK